MPKFTADELHQKLKENLLQGNVSDNLAEHQSDINALDYEQKLELAQNLIIDDQTNCLTHAIEALRINQETEDSFHAIMSRALNLKNTLNGILDQRNPDAANHFLLEMNADHCDEFSQLANSIIEAQGHAIAVRCMLTAKVSERNDIVRKAGQCFGQNNEFSGTCQRAAITELLLDALTSDYPLYFFMHEEYNADLLHEFPELITARLDEPCITEIALSLTELDLDSQSDVAVILSYLSSSAHSSNPFRQILEKLQQFQAVQWNQTPESKLTAEIPTQRPSSPPSPSLSAAGFFAAGVIPAVAEIIDSEDDISLSC